MPVVQVAKSAPLTQVEGFPVEVKGKDKNDKPRKFQRSCEGALHLRPGSTKTITEDELGFIRAKHPKLGRALIVLAQDQQIKASAKQSGASDGDQSATQGLDQGDDKTSEDASGAKNKQPRNKAK